VLYVTDVGQASHFDQVFQVARRAGLDRHPGSDAPPVSLEHVPFGLVQGEDGKKFKTRAGTTVKLKDLLSEAVRIAKAGLQERAAASDKAGDDTAGEADANAGEADEADEAETETEAARIERVASVLGVGAVKYADLSLNRESNYRFSYAKMLALNGNTAPYMLYAYARIKGINRKALLADGAAADGAAAAAGPTVPSLGTKEELALAKQLLRLPEVVAKLEAELYPHQLCDYLFETSQKFNQFYEQCPVNGAETAELRRARASLCGLTADTLQLALGLLGIGVVDRL